MRQFLGMFLDPVGDGEASLPTLPFGGFLPGSKRPGGGVDRPVQIARPAERRETGDVSVRRVDDLEQLSRRNFPAVYHQS